MMHELKVYFCQVTHNCFSFFWHILLQCQELRFLLELKSRMIFSRWQFSLFGAISWLASDRSGHIMRWHWSWHWHFLLFQRHTSFSRNTCDTPLSRVTPPIPKISKISWAGYPSTKESVGLMRAGGRGPDGLTFIPWRMGKCLILECHSHRHLGSFKC